MTYQGERSRPMATENGRYFEVSKLRMGTDGQVSEVLWCEASMGSDHALGTRVVAAASEVVDAMHDGAQVAAVFSSQDRCPARSFTIVEQADGRECLAFDGAPSPGRNLADIETLEG